MDGRAGLKSGQASQLASNDDIIDAEVGERCEPH
jgi:hypothetical protein